MSTILRPGLSLAHKKRELSLLTLALPFRFFALVYPLRSLGHLADCRPWVMGGVWLTGAGLFVVQFTHCKVDTKYHTTLNETMYICSEKWSDIEGKVYTLALMSHVHFMDS